MITRGCIWVERDVIDERKITTVYDRQIWSGRSFTGTDYRVDGSVTCIHIFICIFPGKYFILAWPRIVNLFLFQNTLTECVKALRREPEIFKCEIRAVVKKNNLKKRWAQRSTYRFFKCPQCKQTVRVPKGRGKICITCPKCKTEFIKKS